MGVKVEYQILHEHAFNHISIGMILFHDISSHNLHLSSLGLNVLLLFNENMELAVKPGVLALSPYFLQ